MIRIAVIGTGYVGLVTGSCLSDFGLSVICVDSDTSKIDKLQRGIIPIYEPGLESLVQRNVQDQRLTFTSDLSAAVEVSDVIFIAVGTPSNADGSVHLNYVENVAVEIAGAMNGYKVVVNKSTVPVGTAKLVRSLIASTLAERGVQHEFDVVSNPEFLREGSAIYEFTHPDRVVIGSSSERAIEMMKQVYNVLYLNETPFVITNEESAEMIKYAANSFLAMKITFINEIANLCEKVGANVQDVAKAMGKDGRISPKFLHPGPGYGGSCFPKDTRALANIGRTHGSPLTLVESTIEANEFQKRYMVQKMKSALDTFDGKTIAILGLAFKPNTDDMRDAPVISMLEELSQYQVSLKLYDPVAMQEAQHKLQQYAAITQYAQDEYDALVGADCLVIVTEWNQFRSLDLQKVKRLMKGHHFFDFRNVYERELVEQHGFAYVGVGQ